MPDDHKFQVQGYIWLLNLEWWDFVSYDPRAELPKRIFVQRILRDWTFSDRIDQRVRWFHDLLVSGGSVEEGASIEDALLNGAMKPPKFFNWRTYMTVDNFAVSIPQTASSVEVRLSARSRSRRPS